MANLLDVTSAPSTSRRTQGRSGAFHSVRVRNRYWALLIVLLIAAVGCGGGLLAYGNPMPVGTPQFWLLAERRLNSVIAIAIVAVCHALATIGFQTVTNNRIITPSIMGFEALYVAIHTTTVFIGGATGLIAARTLGTFVFQIVLMVGLALLLYGWMLTGKNSNMHAMLLIGVVIGGGLGSLSTFMQRVLTPSEFDLLTARLFGSVNNADPDFYPIAIPVVLCAGALLIATSYKLNVLALGRHAAVNLGLRHQALSIYVLVLVTVLIAVSTALVGPMSFLGFLVATLTYQLAGTSDHRYLFPLSVVIGFVVLAGAYFLMNNVFSAQGAVSIIIELVGGALFLVVLLRKGSL